MTKNPNAQFASMAYRKAAVSVPPSRAVVLLYDRVLVLLTRAGQATAEGAIETARADVHKAAAILRGLAHIIDFNRGGALAEQLYVMYMRNVVAMLQSLHKPDAPERYRRLTEGLAELRDAWAIIAGLPTRAQEAGARGGHAAQPVESVVAARTAARR